MDLGLHGKTAMVAASSKGLGFGIARELAREGAQLSIGSRTQADIEDAAEALREETGAQVMPQVMDVTDPASILAWSENTIQTFGGIDMLVINAGGPPAGIFDDFNDSEWQDAFELTLMSAVRMIRAVLPSMRRRGGGSILIITSTTVKEPIDFLLLSNVMRSGVTSLAKSLSRQLAPENIRVNNLIPGQIDTDRVRALDQLNADQERISVEEIRAANERNIPLLRYGTIEEFGRIGAFLLSDAASYITGQTIAVDGGAIRTVW